MPRLLIFDLDGTLVDSAPDIITSVNSLTASRGLEPLPGHVIRAAIGEGLRQLIRNLFRESADDPVFLETLERDLKKHYDRHLLDTTRPYPGVAEFLGNCADRIAILSNKHEEFVFKTIAGVGLDHHPWVCIFGGDSLAARKPDPLPFLEVMKTAGSKPEETLMIGDGIPDMVGAKNAGIRAIACEFGYTDPAILQSHAPFARLKSFFDLPELIASLPSTL